MNQTNEQRPFDYIAEAHLTASPHFYGDRVPLAHFGEVLQQAIDALNALDRIKKALFYGRDLGVTEVSGEVWQNCNGLPEWISSHPDEGAKARNIIHAIIGKATEAGELLEALQATAVEGKPFDVANAGEEIGDGFWYDALLARACGLSFDGIQRTNIAKLRHRFPNAFAEYDANNRDLFGERRILEEGSNEKPILDNKREAWECKIGDLNGVEIPPGGDAPMRNAVEKAYFELTGKWPQATFSGWGAKFEEAERAVIENRTSYEKISSNNA